METYEILLVGTLMVERRMRVTARSKEEAIRAVREELEHPTVEDLSRFRCGVWVANGRRVQGIRIADVVNVAYLEAVEDGAGGEG